MNAELKVYWGSKYIGTPISEVQDAAWLRWCIKNLTWLNANYRAEIKNQLERIIYQSA